MMKRVLPRREETWAQESVCLCEIVQFPEYGVNAESECWGMVFAEQLAPEFEMERLPASADAGQPGEL